MSTVQIGITTIGLLNGIVGEAALSPPVAQWMTQRGLEEGAARLLATGLVVAGVTYLSIVLGELVPKRVGQINPERMARLVARPMQWLATLSAPFVRLLAGSTRLVLRLLGIRDQGAPRVTAEAIDAVLTEGADAGVIEHQEHRMLKNVFRLDQRQIGSLMVPRSDIVFLDAELPWEANMERIAGSEHSRFPVVRGRLSEVLGVVSARHLLATTMLGATPDLRRDLQPPVFVPETLTGMELLESMQERGVQLAFVVDEYGEIQGVVTLQDLLEAITGEFRPSVPEERQAVRREDGSWLLDGLIAVPELKEALGLRRVPEEASYHTLAGMLIVLLGRLPASGDAVEWDGWRFEVVDMDQKRIDKVLASSTRHAEREVVPVG